MDLREQIKLAMVDYIVNVGYEDRLQKIAAYGLDDYAGIDYEGVVADSVYNTGTLTKQAADEAITREIRSQIVAAGYINALNKY